MRSDWLLPVCGGPERLKDQGGRKAPPTQKPEALLYRILMASTRPGETVLDPFFGTGTTGAVAKKLGRHFIGLEREDAYVEVAHRRLAAIDGPVDPRLLETPSRRQAPRIPFGWVVERGYLRAGDTLFDERRRHAAKIRADGTLISATAYGDHRGSIHQVGAAGT